MASYRKPPAWTVALLALLLSAGLARAGPNRFWSGYQRVKIAVDSPPQVVITQPVNGGTILEGQVLLITAVATDDDLSSLGGTEPPELEPGSGSPRSVSFTVDGVLVATDFTRPFHYSYPVPEGTAGRSLVLGASATDTAGQTARADDVTLRVIEGPRPVLEVPIGSLDLAIPPAPRLNAVIPDRGRPGDRIRLEGSDFAAVPSHNIVMFGTGRGEVLTAASEALEVIVPKDGSTGPVTVQVELQTSQPFPFEYVSERLPRPPVRRIYLPWFTVPKGE